MAAGAAAAAAIARAIKASGVLVKLEPAEFSKVLNRVKDPLVVVREGGGWFGKRYQYLFSYKGLAFFTGSNDPVSLPNGCEIVSAQSIFIPG